MITRVGVGVLSFLALLILTAIALHAFQSNDSIDFTSSYNLSPHSQPTLTPTPSISLPPLSSYRLVFSDEFDGPDGSPPSPSNWNLETGCGLYNGELQCYTQSTRNAHVQQGRLLITARREATEEVTEVKETVIVHRGNSTARDDERAVVTSLRSRWWNFTSARLTTQHKHEVRFPRVQAFIRLPQAQGLWPALWLLGASIDQVGWPSCGEVDILEAVNEEGLVHSTLHWNHYGLRGANVSHRQVSASSLPYQRLDGFHVFEVAMEEERTVFALDGSPWFVVDLRGREELDAFSGVGRQPWFVLLNLACGGWWPGWTMDLDALPATMEVDYVRVYERR